MLIFLASCLIGVLAHSLLVGLFAFAVMWWCAD